MFYTNPVIDTYLVNVIASWAIVERSSDINEIGGRSKNYSPHLADRAGSRARDPFQLDRPMDPLTTTTHTGRPLASSPHATSLGICLNLPDQIED
jgi:hypothetical protein